MALAFKKATKLESRLRMALIGPTGSGKTFSALAIASGLGERVAVIDTERGSASKYADRFGEFDVLELESFAPAMYCEALELAGRERYDVVIVDSLSHAWMGKDGALEQVDRAAKRSAGNSFAAWRDVTPQHNQLVDALLRCPAHLLVTMRSKTEYVLEEDSRGKKVPKKVGMAPIQRDGVEYEFDVVAELDVDHNLMVTKTRMPELDGAVVKAPGRALGSKILLWTRGEKPAPETHRDRPSEPPPAAAAAVKKQRARFMMSWKHEGWGGKPIDEAPSEVIAAYIADMEKVIRDEEKAEHHAKARAAKALAEDVWELLYGDGTPKPDPVAEGMQQQIDKEESQPGGELDRNPEWGLTPE